jgi:hypothetical protein
MNNAVVRGKVVVAVVANNNDGPPNEGHSAFMKTQPPIF